MFTFALQVWDSVVNHRPHYFALFLVFAYTVWLMKHHFAAQYRPFDDSTDVTASVLIPVVDEDEAAFTDLLVRIRRQRPHEIVVVINGPRQPHLERACAAVPGVRALWTATPGKRHAIALGMTACTGDVVVLNDSDTLWTERTLAELLKPFADPTVGGVTTSQRIFDADRSALTRFADWMEHMRIQLSMPAMSHFGTVGCLPGRTIAFRRHIVERNMDKFLSEPFLGVYLEISDDRTLTNYTLKDGYRTVFQRTSHVLTEAPSSWRKYLRQQFRWAQGSQYNTLRMTPFMVRRTPFLAALYWADILIPFFWIGTLVNVVWKVYLAEAAAYSTLDVLVQAPLIALGIVASLALRSLPHLREKPRDLLFLPVFAVLLSLVLTPVRVLGFLRMGVDSGWGTRRNAAGATGQEHVLGLLPYLLGGGLLVFFSAAGPWLETPDELADRLRLLGAHRDVLVPAVLAVATVGLAWRLVRQARSGGPRSVVLDLEYRHLDLRRMLTPRVDRVSLTHLGSRPSRGTALR